MLGGGIADGVRAVCEVTVALAGGTEGAKGEVLANVFSWLYLVLT